MVQYEVLIVDGLLKLLYLNRISRRRVCQDGILCLWIREIFLAKKISRAKSPRNVLLLMAYMLLKFYVINNVSSYFYILITSVNAVPLR